MIDAIFKELRIEFTINTDVPAHCGVGTSAVVLKGAVAPGKWISALLPKPLSIKALSIGGGG